MKRDTIVLGTGIFLLSFGIFLNLYWQNILDEIISQKFILSNTSGTYEPWVKSRIPLFFQFYFFNWTNPSDMKSPDYKPIFEEVGPYKFWEKMEKINITWNDNGTVSYNRLRRWYFEPEGSNGTLDDKITTINTVAVSASKLTREWSSVVRMSLSVAFTGIDQKIHVTKSVGEFLFDGYEDKFLSTGSRIPGLSSIIPFDRFGWFYKKNGSYDSEGVFNVHTGQNGMDHFGEIENWKFKNHTGFFRDHCGDVKGSGGDFFPPKRTKTDDVVIFSSDLCRYVEFKYVKEEVISGLRGYKYVAGPELMDNGTLNSKNKCFSEGYSPVGVLNVTTCRFGAPVFHSYPHFTYADPILSDAVEGMKPDPERHDIYITLEPNYGIPLEVAGRLQLNLLVEPDQKISLFHGIKPIYFPVIWFEQKVTVPAENLKIVKILVILPMAGFITSILMIITGTVCILAVIFRNRCFRNQKTIVINRYRDVSKAEVEDNQPMEFNVSDKEKAEQKNGNFISKSLSNTHL